MNPVIIVHGGAKEIPAEEADAHRDGCKRATAAGWEVLDGGGSALDAVEAAIRVLEDDPTFNAGLGSELNADGDVQMDAGLMDGESLKAGAVGFLQTARHPISLARRVYESTEVLLVGDGADRFAVETGSEVCANEDLKTPKQVQKWEDKQSAKENNTVGCVAMDSYGNIAAGASTGGTGGNRRGRIGDTPQIGAGIYSDTERGGCSFTGDGESISRVVLAKFVVDRLGDLYFPDEVTRKSIMELATRTGGDGGCVAIDRNGRIGWWHNSANMAVGYRHSGLCAPVAYLHKCEEIGRGC